VTRWAQTLARPITVLVLGVLPVVLIVAALTHWQRDGTLAWDFHHELYPQAQTMLDGDDPYPSAEHDPRTGTNWVWPPGAAALVAPLTVLPAAAADVVVALLGLACFATALWVVGVRDWLVYGAFALWPPVFVEPGLAHLTPSLALVAAVAWRARDAGRRPGVAVGIGIAVKLLVWPLLVWLAASGRKSAAAVGALVAAASLVLILPFTSFTDYGDALLRLGRAFDQDSYSVFGLVVQAGGPEAVGRALTVALGGALLLGTWRYRSFTLAIAAALAISPIVWLDYFALAAIPLAVVRPRFSLVWLVPLATVGLEGAGLEIGDTAGSLRTLAAYGVVFAVAFRAERLAYEEDRRVPAVQSVTAATTTVVPSANQSTGSV
jgi:alpha-1,2-mannosyltransferase